MEGFCRGCLQQYSEPSHLLQYTEKNRRMFVYSTGLQVKRNDSFTFQLCKECFFNMKQSCKFKKQCRTSDKMFRNYLMIKNNEDSISFGSFIKNVDENLTLRIPFNPGHSTPAHQKMKDDDNDSTCTSIRNFITDILDGEVMPSTEASIIREVIEEEADVLDDSLDSHWLQDDNLSIGSDFNMDFGFSPFATPRSVQDDHCYTPKTINDIKLPDHLTFNKTMKHRDVPRISQNFDMPLIDIDSNMDFENNNPTERTEIQNMQHEDLDDDSNQIAPINEFNNSIPREIEDMVTENSISSKLQCFQTDLLARKTEIDRLESNKTSALVNYDENANDSVALSIQDNNICIVLNHGKAKKKSSDDDIPVDSELEFYINKAELKKRISEASVEFSAKKKADDKPHCTIDRNLEIALENEGSKDFALDQLLVSPQVSIPSGASTPTIKTILYGGNIDSGTVGNLASTPLLKNVLGENMTTEITPKYFAQLGLSNEDCDENVDIQIEVDTKNISEIKGTAKTNFLGEFLKDGEEIKFDSNDAVTIGCKDETVPSEVKIEPTEVLEEFLKGAESSPLKDNSLNEELMDQNMDLLEQRKDQDIFKKPLPPPHDKYDLAQCLCKLCEKTFISSKSLKIHFCKIHKYKIPSSDPHRNQTQNNKYFVCDCCGKNVKGAANYARHKKAHEYSSGADSCQCDHCKMFFKSHFSLLLHMKKHNANKRQRNGKEYVCSTCGLKSISLTNLKLHQRRHLKDFTLTCSTCGKGFYRNYELQQHMRLHTGDRPFNCQYCTKAFKRREQLYKHVDRHMGRLQHKCHVCEEEFATKHILSAHFRTKKCIKNRTEDSKLRPEDQCKVTASYFKGSIDKINRMFRLSGADKSGCEINIENNAEPSELNITQENIMLKSKLDKDLNSKIDHEYLENDTMSGYSKDITQDSGDSVSKENISTKEQSMVRSELEAPDPKIDQEY